MGRLPECGLHLNEAYPLLVVLFVSHEATGDLISWICHQRNCIVL